LINDQSHIIKGQYSLTVYQGKCPASIELGEQDPVRLLNQLVNKGAICGLDYLQIISRVGTNASSKEPFMTQWHPEFNPRMTYICLKDKVNLHRYVLHANHKKITEKSDRCEWLTSEVELMA